MVWLYSTRFCLRATSVVVQSSLHCKFQLHVDGKSKKKAESERVKVNKRFTWATTDYDILMVNTVKCTWEKEI